jgi:hypothetical protein
VAIGSNKLKQMSRLCDAHFLEEDIIKGKLMVGSFYPEKWHLRKNAVRKLLLSNNLLFINVFISVIIFFNTVQGLQPSLRKPLQTLNGQNPRVLGKKKSLQITTVLKLPFCLFKCCMTYHF